MTVRIEAELARYAVCYVGDRDCPEKQKTRLKGLTAAKGPTLRQKLEAMTDTARQYLAPCR